MGVRNVLSRVLGFMSSFTLGDTCSFGLTCTKQDIVHIRYENGGKQVDSVNEVFVGNVRV